MTDEKTKSPRHLEKVARDLKTNAQRTGAAASDLTRGAYETVQQTAVEYGRATDKFIRKKPYVSLGCAFGAGVLLGMYLSRPKAEEEDED